MFRVTTLRTQEDLSLTGSGIHVPACGHRARLAGVVRIDLSQYSSLPGELVGEELGQEAPTLIEDTPGESSVGLHHVADLQILNHDRAVVLGVVVTKSMGKIFSLSPCLALKSSDLEFRFLPVPRTLLTSGYPLLSALQALHRLAVEAGGLEEQSVRVGNNVRDASVDSNDRQGLWRRSLDLDFAHNRSEPLIAVPFERAGLRSTFERTVDHSTKVSQLGEPQESAVKTPGFRMRLRQAEEVSSLSLPSRSTCQAFETPLPSLVQLDEKLRANVARNVCKPRKLLAKLGQLVDLIERRGEDSLIPWTGETKKTLLIREVPKEPHSAPPLADALDLFGSRTHPIVERLADKHLLLGPQFSLYNFETTSQKKTNHLCAFNFDTDVPASHHGTNHLDLFGEGYRDSEAQPYFVCSHGSCTTQHTRTL